MLKNAYLSMTFSLLACTHVICLATDSNTVIATAIKDIMMEVKTALLLKEKAEKHFADIFQDIYEAKKQHCLAVLKIIAESPEFVSTLEHVTNEQVRLITQDMVAYNNIIIDPSAYPLEQKVEAELSLAAFDGQQEELFNIFYVVFAIISGSKMLINKLELAEKELTSHQAVTAMGQTPQA